MISKRVLVASLALATPTSAQQALSTSMVECGVILSQSASNGATTTRTAEQVSKIQRDAKAFFDAAEKQGIKEGLSDLPSHLASEKLRLEQKWDGRFEKVLLLKENLDWVAYCNKMGRAKGVL